MGRPRKMENLFKPDQSTNPKGAQQGSAGYDNIRQNIDPNIITTSVTTNQGSFKILYLSDDKLTYFKYNTASSKLELWVNGRKIWQIS